ncbi:hypothetical protein [Nonlabens antarcticus]|uniref:hypothetical protein n=1 Tax=Nonlabens antarcticus TaxID=392714 RepID=UPI001891E04A|nr:hypothetical protein [Nonlabens antarcticus]
MKLYSIFFLLLGSMTMASTHPIDKYNKTKKINKTYSVNSDALVRVENSFGNVTVQTWDQNSVSIEVTVEVSGNDEDRVNERLRMIDVDFSASKSKVSAVSKIPNENGSGLFSFFNSKSKTNTRVDYIVKIPRNSPLDVENDYGAVIIDKMTAPLTLNCDFGRLQIGQLLSPDNKLAFDYTDNSHIDYMKGGSIEADFSKFKLYGADVVDFRGDYTTVAFGKMKKLKYNSDFSTLSIENATTIDGRGDYSTVKIDSFETATLLKASFGKIIINNLATGFKSLTIKSDYTDVRINHDRNVAFDYELSAEFASINLGNDLQTVTSRKENNEAYKQGYNTVAKSGSRIEINSSFGSVTLKTNN